MPNIKIILGSNRSTRFATQPGQWLLQQGKKLSGAQFELIDLAQVNLPFLDEPIPAMHNKYQNEHTKAWSAMIDEADGFVFVVPEYNHGVTPVLKNALDYLYREWRHKPVAFLSYGADAGGTRAVEQLRSIVGFLAMYDITEHIMLAEYYLNIDKEGQFKFTQRHESAAQKMLGQLVFWADHMKRARAELAAQVGK